MLKVLRIALDEVGYLEKRSNADLYSKTGNAGYGNFTLFAKDLDALGDFYNGPKQGYPWCEVFVDWCMVQAYGEDLALRLLCQPRRSAGAGCTQSAGYYKQAGRFYSTPKVGDQIYFSWGGEVEHTGLVWNVDASKVYTVEGNTSGDKGVVPNGGGVFKKSYSLKDSAIYGYGRPDYSLVSEAPSEPEKPTEPEKPKEEDQVATIKIPWAQMGSEGETVRTLQRLLVSNGFSVGRAGCDGIFGSDTFAAVTAWQRTQKGLSVDGIVGPASWNRILGVK